MEPPNFPIPEFGGGGFRKRYRIQFKLDTIMYARKKVEGGQEPGGTVGITYTTKALGLPDKATLAAWVKNRKKYEDKVQRATEIAGVRGTKEAKKLLSLHPGMTVRRS